MIDIYGNQIYPRVHLARIKFDFEEGEISEAWCGEKIYNHVPHVFSHDEFLESVHEKSQCKKCLKKIPRGQRVATQIGII